MFGLGFWEILVILALALIFIGPQKLPDIAKSLGKGLREFRRAADELRHSVTMEDVQTSDPPGPSPAPPPPSGEAPPAPPAPSGSAPENPPPETKE